MSVQVRRRREAAAFLASFVGAQGELLVDTTDNRVQVHDGVTPGGWPAAGIGDLPGRNALVNGNFGVNQRGYASGASLAAGAYAHDRWKAGTAGSYTFTQTNPDTVVTITSGTLVQAVDVGNVYATSMWLTWTGTATARVWQGSASGTFAAGTATTVGGVKVNALLVTGLTLGVIANVEFGTGTLGLVQFEAALPNAGPTRFERRHGELALCQRYFQRWQQPPLRGSAGGTSAARIGMVLPVTMRASPTLIMTGNLPLLVPGVAASTLQSINTSYCTPTTLELDGTTSSSMGSTNGLALIVYQTGSSTLDVSAEL